MTKTKTNSLWWAVFLGYFSFLPWHLLFDNKKKKYNWYNRIAYIIFIFPLHHRLPALIVLLSLFFFFISLMKQFCSYLLTLIKLTLISFKIDMFWCSFVWFVKVEKCNHFWLIWKRFLISCIKVTICCYTTPPPPPLSLWPTLTTWDAIIYLDTLDGNCLQKPQDFCFYFISFFPFLYLHRFVLCNELISCGVGEKKTRPLCRYKVLVYYQRARLSTIAWVNFVLGICIWIVFIS